MANSIIYYLNKCHAGEEVGIFFCADQEQDQGGVSGRAVHGEDVHPHALHPRQIRGGTRAHHWHRLHGQEHPHRSQHPPHAVVGHRRAGTLPLPHPQLPQGRTHRLHCLRPHQDIKSFDSLNEWIDLCHNNKKEKTIVILLGNKCDLREEREVDPEQIRSKIEETSLPYFEVSAKTSENIKEAFNYAGNEYFNIHLNGMEMTFSSVIHEKSKIEHPEEPKSKTKSSQLSSASSHPHSHTHKQINDKKQEKEVKLTNKKEEPKKKSRCC